VKSGDKILQFNSENILQFVAKKNGIFPTPKTLQNLTLKIFFFGRFGRYKGAKKILQYTSICFRKMAVESN
jgi:hypothetical protein